MKVLFVGQNPSSKNTNTDVPFIGTKSEKVLKDWINALKIKKYHIVNASNKLGKVTLKDADPFITSTIYGFCINGYEVIALGNYASKVCNKYGISHFKLPHPSGLNRKLNNVQYVEQILKECRKYLTTPV